MSLTLAEFIIQIATLLSQRIEIVKTMKIIAYKRNNDRSHQPLVSILIPLYYNIKVDQLYIVYNPAIRQKEKYTNTTKSKKHYSFPIRKLSNR